MKKLILLSLLSITALISNAQYVTIPDSNFVAYLQLKFPTAMVGNQMDTTASLITEEPNVYVSAKSIKNLDGIQFFDSLKNLSCIGNQLITLPPLPSSLSILRCDRNQLTSLPDLPSSLTRIDCSDNKLINLPALPDSLNIIHCNNNQLGSLPILPLALEILHCYENKFITLPSLPNRLTDLKCDNNQLISVPALPSSLNVFSCNGNKLSSLPSLNNSLRYLFCDNNLLLALPTNLPVSLRSLSCKANKLTILPNLPSQLNTLNCSSNDLINLPSLPSDLTWLNCDSNQLLSLPTLASMLISLSCHNNQLPSIPTLPSSLNVLDCSNNLLTSLPALPSKLFTLFCQNNQLATLPQLPQSMSRLKCTDNSSLTCLPYFSQESFFRFEVKTNTKITCLPRSIKVNEIGDSSLYLPICLSISGCPIAYSVIGNVHQDTSANCSADSINNGVLLNGVKMLAYVNDTLKSQTYTDINGFYSFEAETNDSVRVQIDTVNSSFVSCPASGKREMLVTATDSLFENQDFGEKCAGVDLGVLSIQGTFRPTRNRPVYIRAGDLSQQFNLGCGDGVSGTVTTTIIGSANYIAPLFGALTPTSVVGKILTYTIADFGTIDPDSAFNIIVNTDSNAVVGSDICIKTKVNTSVSDINANNDSLLFCGEVVNSYDPNDKAAYPSELATPDTWITYTVRFQNTGTDTAYDIIIRDTLSSYLDESTFTYLDGSVQPVVSLTGKAIMFNYRNINLLDSFSNEPESHGWVQYKVRTKSDLPPFAKIENTAFIYFDLNSAVVTNTTTNEYVIRSSKDITSCDSALVNGEFYFATQTIIDTIGPEVITTDLVINSVNSETISTGATILSNQADAQYQWLDCDSSFSSIDSETSQSFTATRNGEYAVEVSHNGCIDTSNCVTITTLSITENSLAEYFKIYPNPSKGNITIAFDENHSQIQARIQSITGQEIAIHTTSNSNTLQFDFEAAKGIYFIKITTENGGKSVVRVVKE